MLNKMISELRLLQSTPDITAENKIIKESARISKLHKKMEEINEQASDAKYLELELQLGQEKNKKELLKEKLKEFKVYTEELESKVRELEELLNQRQIKEMNTKECQVDEGHKELE
jgi:chromosome segregation ATPase